MITEREGGEEGEGCGRWERMEEDEEINDWFFRSPFCTCKATVGRGQPGLMRYILL